MTHHAPSGPCVVTVGQAILERGKVNIENQVPKRIEVQVGQELHLHLQYRFEESSRDQEEFHIRLRSHIGDLRAPEADHHLRDHLWRSDAEWGFVRQAYPDLPVGTHELVVDMDARYGKQPWQGQGEETLDRAELAVSVPVVVSKS